MLSVQRSKGGEILFTDDEREGFFTATIHQPEGSDGFEVNIKAQGKRRKSRSVFASRYLAPTLHAASQIVTSEYHLADAIVDSDDCTLVADFWLDQLDGGLRWRIKAQDMEIVGEDDEDEDDWDEDGEEDDDDPEGDPDGSEGDVIRMIGRITRG